jgi:hypothetical protein
MEEQGKKTKDAINVGAPSKGIDFNAMTLGLSGAIGINKGDDLVKMVNNNGILNAIASLTPIIGWSKNVNEANGGKGFATTQEKDYNDTVTSLNEQGDANYELVGELHRRKPEFTKGLKESKKEQDFIDLKQAEKNRLQTGGSVNKDKIAKIDEEIAQAATRRDSASLQFSKYRNIIDDSVRDLKEKRVAIDKSADYTPGQKRSMIESIDSQLAGVEKARSLLESMNKKFNDSGDRILAFNVALSDMAAKIEEASEAAEKAFNKREVDRLTARKEGRMTDEFASVTANTTQATNERILAEEKLLATKKAIAEVDKLMQDPTIKNDLAKITVNGKSIDGETSAALLEQAKLGKTDGEKQRIDKLITRRKAIDSIPGLEKNSLEAEDKEFQAKQNEALERFDRKKKARETEFKDFEGNANLRLINAQKGNKIGESSAAIRKAEIDNVSAKESKDSVQKEIDEINRLYNSGMMSNEEYTKRSMDLRSRLVDANVKAAAAELEVEKAKNRKILQDWELTIKKRELEAKRTSTFKAIDLINQQKGNKINESDVAIKKAENDESDAKTGLTNIEKQKQELESLRDKGIITAEEYERRRLEIDSNILDAKRRVAEAELAVEQAKNRKILQDWELTIKKRDLAAKTTKTYQTIDLIKAQRGNAMGSDDVSIRKAEIEKESADKGLQNIEKQKQELQDLRNRGVITAEELEKRMVDMQSNILDAKQRSAEAELALEQAKNAKIVNEFERSVKSRQFYFDALAGETSNQIKRSALSGRVYGNGGETEVREGQIVISRMRIDELKKDRRVIDSMRDNGTIGEKDYESRAQESVNQIRLEEEKLLNLEIQKRIASYQVEFDSFKRNTEAGVRGLEAQRNASELLRNSMSARQSLLESQVGLIKAQQSYEEQRLTLQGEGLVDSFGNITGSGQESDASKRSAAVQIDNLKLQNLTRIQAMEMRILDLKERQQRSSLRQLEIEAQIAVAKQKIALQESMRKLKEAKLTGDTNAIANAQEEVTGQTQILGFENEKLRAIGDQNKLAEERLGIERKTAEVGMATEAMKTRADVERNRRNSSGAGGGGGATAGGGGSSKGFDNFTFGPGGGYSNGATGKGLMLEGHEVQDYDFYKDKFGKKSPLLSRKEQAMDVFNSIDMLSGRKREIALTAAQAAGFGDVAKASDTASRIKENGGGAALSREMNKLNFSSGSADVVKAINRLGDRLENAYQNSGDNYITGDYSGIMNRQIESRNNRL